MPLLAYRVKQSTNTIGAGTLVLNAAETNARSFNAAFGASSRRILYMIQFANGYEMGLGDFDGGSPGNLTRATVLASSNANALVTLPGGTKDVFAVFDPAAREVISISATATLALADLGNTVIFTGASPATLNLPAISTTPTGSGWMIRNAGMAAITIDPNGAETINGAANLTLQAGQAAFIFDGGSAWECVIAGNAVLIPIRTQTVSGVSAVDFSLPTGFRQFRLDIIGGRVATAGQALVLRCGVGATFDSGATDYDGGFLSMTNTFINSNGSNIGSFIGLTGGLLSNDARSLIEAFIDPGSASTSFLIRSSAGTTENTIPSFRVYQAFSIRQAAGVKDAIRIFASGGANISGTFTLAGVL
jgi:hypothetical protein